MKELEDEDSASSPKKAQAETPAKPPRRAVPEPQPEPATPPAEPPADAVEPSAATPDQPAVTATEFEGRRHAREKKISWDFETGDLRGWTRSGTAFDFQPTYGDNPTGRQRGQPAHNQGDFWIGTYEKRTSASEPAGQVQGDGPTGRLISKPFMIHRPGITFLVGGGCDVAVERVGLIVGGKEVRQSTGKCTETMEKASWDGA